MAAFLAAAAAPAAGFFFWVDSASLSREKEAARDKHLNMARQLSATADLLVRERVDVLRRYAHQVGDRIDDDVFLRSIAGLGFRHLCVFDPIAGVVLHRAELTESPSFNATLGAALMAQSKAGGTIQVLPAQLDASGRPTLFMAARLESGPVAFAALDPKFIADLGRSVSFGQRGHAVIVDQTGQALAHPRSDWLREMRNLAGVKPVAALLHGGNGVVEFHSPAADADMIAGYVVSPALGWGAMVVQPVEELHASAGSFVFAALSIIGPLTLLFAIVGGGVVARMLARPIERVADAARRFGAGEQSARAPEMGAWAVTETGELARRFNAMADAVRAHEDSLRMSLDQAKVADRAKTVFLANMSHELRTPLNAVIGFSEVIASELLGPVRNAKYLEYAHDISSSARHLLSLINDVLDLSRVEADRIEIERAPVEVASVLCLAARQIGPQAEARGLRLTVDPPPADMCVAADERRILQILLNLLTNAVRFTPRGGEVRLSATAEGDVMRFVVADDGIGMNAEEQALAILPFGQPHLPADPAERGCGLGLPLAQRLARLHGGDLAIESASGKGCRVTVDIPIHAPESASEEAAEAA